MTDIPVGLILKYYDAIPAISAGETLDRATSASIGSGTMKNPGQLTRRLARLADGGTKRNRPAPTPAALAAMGIAVEVVSNG